MVNMMIVELKSDALKDRHWKTLCKQLRVSLVLSELTLGQVWDVDTKNISRLQMHFGDKKNYDSCKEALGAAAEEQADLVTRQEISGKLDD